MENEPEEISKKTRIIIMVAVALVIGFIHLSYIRPRYGDSLPLILFQFFPLYFLWKILFGEKKEDPKNPAKKKTAGRDRNKAGNKNR